MKETKYNNVYQLLDLDKVEQAKAAFEVYPEENSVEYLLISGNIEQRLQNWKEAMNAYSKVLELEPENKLAKNNLHIIQNILSFWNPELYNP